MNQLQNIPTKMIRAGSMRGKGNVVPDETLISLGFEGVALDGFHEYARIVGEQGGTSRARSMLNERFSW